MWTKFLILVLLILSNLSCVRGRNESNVENLTIYGLRGSPGVGIIHLFEEPPEITGFNVKVEALAQADLMAARFIAGEVQVGILPPNMAAKIYTSGGDIKMAAVIGEGMLSLLTSDPNIKEIEDLRGKTVALHGQGATPEYVFQRILRSHGLIPNTDVILNYALGAPEIAQSLIAGRISLALLPEPFATMALLGKPDLILVSDIQEEWIKAEGIGNYPMTLLVFNGTFATANADVVEEILNAVRASIEQVITRPAEAGDLVEKHGLGISAPVVTAAVSRSNYVFIPAIEARPSLEALFNVFLEYDPVSIGGVLPGDGFYLR